jgi:predicted nucleic acid-binding Zn ribbon protein
MASEISLQKALQQFLQKSRLKEGIRSLQIEEVWEELMGKTIARYTDKIQIVQHTLFITTSVAPLKNELVYQKNTIRERVNEALGENIITDVVIQ